MLEKKGDIWESGAEAICVTTNGVVKKDGTLVMGAGIAKQAATRFEHLARDLGKHVMSEGNIPAIINVWHTSPFVISFPTKHHWKDPSDLGLVTESARRILKIADSFAKIDLNLKSIATVRPGCGHGQLDWEQVRPALADIFDDRFTVWSPK